MTPRPPARLVGYFASKAPICVIARRGPTRHSQLCLWHTDTDEFIPGQWLHGHVNRATLSSDGKYFAVGVMGAKPRGRLAGEQYQLVCRPPYWTAIEGWHKPLCLGLVAFLPDDRLVCPPYPAEFGNATTPCPFIREGYGWPLVCDSKQEIVDASQGPASGFDQRGRRILFESGQVFLDSECGKQLLWDSNPFQFEQFVAPDWAITW